MTFRSPIALGLGGALLGAGVSAAYWAKGFHPSLPYVLAIAIVAIAISLGGGSKPGSVPGISRGDVAAIAVLLLVLIPLYSLRVYTTPWQVNTDEVAFLGVTRGVLAEAKPDLFGLSWYFGCPVAAFMFFGKIAQLLGGVDLFHVRLSQSFLGLACVVAAYFLFRRFMPRWPAFLCAGVFGANHSLIAYSRMANWHGSSLFLESIAILFLTIGLQRQSKRALFLSGVTCGAGFYFYFPGRILLPLCVVLLCAAWVLRLSERGLTPLLRSLALLIFGWSIATAPILIATAKAPPQNLSYQREQLLIYPEGQKLAQTWTETKTPMAAWKANARNGLLAFNSRTVDHGWLYANYNHGFADPATGVLLWIGFAIALWRVFRHIRKRGQATEPEAVNSSLGSVVAIIGFLVLYLTLALVVTKAPNYQRLLMTLPFVAYFAGTAIWWLVTRLIPSGAVKLGGIGARGMRPALAGLTVAVILVVNILIFGDFVAEGRRLGHEVGSTGRFVEARKSEPGHTWILAADKNNMYYWWGEPVWWQGWFGTFAGPNQPVKVVSPTVLDTLTTPGRSTVFIARNVWQKFEPGFRATHGVGAITNIMPDGRLLAVEVQPK